jgi:hypothetical protein
MDSSNQKLTGAQKEELMDTVKQQIAVANAHELLKVLNLILILILIYFL